MAKTIQVRVGDDLRSAADMLFTSLGLDTSTAIRMFLVAAIEAGGIPFAVGHNTDQSATIKDAIARRKAGGEFLTATESLSHMQAAIKSGRNYDK